MAKQSLSMMTKRFNAKTFSKKKAKETSLSTPNVTEATKALMTDDIVQRVLLTEMACNL